MFVGHVVAQPPSQPPPVDFAPVSRFIFSTQVMPPHTTVAMALVPGQVVAVASPENVTPLTAAAAMAVCAAGPVLLH